MAPTAAPRTVDRDRVPFFETRNTFSKRGDPTGVFMTQREGRPEAQVLFHDVQIRVAHASTADLDQHLPSTHYGLRNLLDLSRSTNANKSDRLHRAPPRSIRHICSLPSYCDVIRWSLRGGSMSGARSSAGATIPTECRAIEVRVAELRQLFNAIDPSPFRDRDLDQRAEEFIVEWARDLPRDARLALLVHLERSSGQVDEAPMVSESIHQHFKQRAVDTRRRLRELFRRGRISLVIALAFLGTSIAVGDVVASVLHDTGFAEIILPVRSSSRWSGVVSSGVVLRSPAMRPISVRMPVAVTTAFPCP